MTSRRRQGPKSTLSWDLTVIGSRFPLGATSFLIGTSHGQPVPATWSWTCRRGTSRSAPSDAEARCAEATATETGPDPLSARLTDSLRQLTHQGLERGGRRCCGAIS